MDEALRPKVIALPRCNVTRESPKVSPVLSFDTCTDLGKLFICVL